MRGSKINIRIILKIIGLLLVLEGFFIITSIPFSIYYGSPTNLSFSLFNGKDDFWALVISGVFVSTIGLIVWLMTRRAKDSSLGKREGYVIVSLSWLVISLFGAIPFVLSGSIPNFTNAFFETISGFTTTGASILNDIEALPKGILFWRSMTHWMGGMGIIVLTLAILPFLGIGGMQLFIAEVPGPTPDKIHPRITATAKRLWGIYVLLTAAETILLMTGGMDLFDAICHAFGTMATGGFSTQNSSIANYSPYIQYIIILFMIFAGINFTLHYLALHGKLKTVWKNEELRYYLKLMGGVTIIIAVSLILTHGLGIEKGFRDALFQVVSITTTTGYVTTNYLNWPFFLWMIIFILMFAGGCAGSTGGSIKMVRQLLLLKNSLLELKRLIHPHAIIPVRINGKPVSQDITSNILAFFLIYILVFSLGSVFMSFIGLEFESAVGSVAATLGNIGPAIGSVGPAKNYADIPVVGKWFLSFLMLLGRLELFTILILLSPAFWKR